ncbi:MAG: Fe-S protein assembly co-chaperone HscB [Polyangiaceae bacterium]|nr:Fe-S protein assembly co-chaperone HscB [Polyangiaceae bacterium]
MALDPFALLGIPPRFDLDIEATERRFRELSRVVHPDRFAGAGAHERRQALGRSIDLNDAWRKLRDPISRAEALLRAQGVEVSEASQPRASQALLLDFMELREQLAETRASRDVAAARLLAAEVQGREGAVLRRLSEGFTRLAEASPAERGPLAASLLEGVGELRYVRRFLDEVRAIEED